ncbi:TPA: hypothetical protein N0F65_000474, partial [Lagenidium giganteum]
QIRKENKPTSVFEVAVITQEFNCDVLFLPVGYPELNPIELEVETLAHAALDTFDSAKWKRYERHCMAVEQMFIGQTDAVPVHMDE